MPKPSELETQEHVTVAIASAPAPPEKLTPFVAVVADGPDAGNRYVLDASLPDRVLIGKSPACFIRLTDAAVSRRHAALDLSARHVCVQDLHSTNGTLINGVAVERARLDGGEFIRMGRTVLHLQRLDPITNETMGARATFGGVVGASESMRRLYPLLEQLAVSQVNTLIEGETGTGKEVVAEAIHNMGPRRSGPFVVFDCVGTPATLIESALFGHERGAFTGADAVHVGAFERAHGGTLLLDEIGDLPLALQPKLLRVIERKQVQRVGGKNVRTVDVRVLAATRRDLDREIQEGRFRDDLFYRLCVARVELPPLRRRPGDVRLLTEHFWELHRGAWPPPQDVVERFEAYAWPGNVRELANAVRRAIALAGLGQDQWAVGAQMGRADAGSDPSEFGVLELLLADDLPYVQTRDRLLRKFERLYVARALARHGTIGEAAEASGLGTRYFREIRKRAEEPDDE